MCGLVGAVFRNSSPQSLRYALEILTHRGPDGEGEMLEGQVWLGHRRLSIIDVSDSASQPMRISGCGTIAFNGEIYDHEAHRRALAGKGHIFTTCSDTEVLLRGLAEDGVEFLRGLHGMYAFAWLEPDGRRLWLARDHAGMKPLYLWQGAGGLAFASEVRALARVIAAIGGTVRLDGGALRSLLAWGAVPEPLTILQNVHMLPAGTVVRFDLDDLDRPLRVPIERARRSLAVGSEDTLVERTVEAIRSAVQRHLVADTPVALFLSGGIDSGVLAAELSRSSTRPLAISVVLGSRGTEDEPVIVRSLARRLGLPCEVVTLPDWASRLMGALDAYDQPSVDGMNTYLVAGVARQLGYKAVLSGLGADEVFGGYTHLRRPMLWLRHAPAVTLAGRFLGPMLGAGTYPVLRRVGMVVEGAARGERPQRSRRRLFPDSFLARLLPDVRPAVDPPDREDGADPLELEQRTYLRDTLLRDTDVMGMAHGVEIRAPYLDPDVLDLAKAIGSPAILDAAKPPKWLLRRGWAGELQPRTLKRRKSGFTLDLASWLRGAGAPFVAEAWSGLTRCRFLDQAVLAAAWRAWSDRLRSGHPAAWTPIFAFVQVERQVRRWGEPA